eukprot:4635140-Ditylum_brightwellii.AAC.1
MQQTRSSKKKAAEAKKADSKEATTSSPAPVLRRSTRNSSISRPLQRSTWGKEKKKDAKKGR